MNTIIEKIRAEVERRKKAIHSTLFNDEYNDFLSFLSDLEKEEKPMQEGLEEEIVKVCDDFAFPLYGLADDYGRELINNIARHFARWGAVHIHKNTKKVGCSSEIPKDLESYAQRVENYYDVGEDRGYLCTHRGDIKNAVLAGAKWQKEQMMDEWLKDRDGCFWDGVEEGKKAMREQMMKEAISWLKENANKYIVDLGIGYEQHEFVVGGMCWVDMEKAITGEEGENHHC